MEYLIVMIEGAITTRTQLDKTINILHEHDKS